MRRALPVLVLMLLLAACGNAAENLAEEIIESQTGGEIDVEGDSVIIQSEDGDATIEFSEDDDGVTVSGTDESGEDITIEMGGTEVPDDFPMPIYSGGEVTHVSSFDMGDTSSYSVTLEIDPDDAADALGFYQEWLEGEGMSITSSETMVIAESDDVTSIVQVSPYGSYSEVVMTWTPNG